MKILLMLIPICIMFTMQNCTSDSDFTDLYHKNSTDAISHHMVIKFEDHIYETDVITTEDSVIYLNEKYAEIYRSKINNDPNIAAVISSDESGITYLEYFPSEKQLSAKYNFIQLNNQSEDISTLATRANVIDLMPSNNTSPVIAVAELYDDKNFKDTELISYATTTWATAVPRLKDLGFNDKASSIKVFNKMETSKSYVMSYYYENNGTTGNQQKVFQGSQLRPVLKCHHNSDFSGTVIYCIASPTGSSVDHTDSNLKSIGWNDRISAIEWLIVYNFSVFNGDNPEIPAHADC